jgi:TolB-like protein
MGEVQTVTARENIKTIVILPFKVNAAEKSTPVREGIERMLYSRLSWRDNVMVIPPQKLKTHLSDINDSKPYGINEIARLTHSDFILAGTITRLGGSFSIDIQVYDIENKRYMAFFEQSPKKDELVNKVNRIAASINQKIFARSTMAWEKMKQEKQAYIKEQQRKNPEYMMKTPRWKDTKQSVGWKIWKYLF